MYKKNKKTFKKLTKKKAEELFNKILKIVVEPITGTGTTYLTQLNKIGKQILGIKFKGVYPSDKIPKLNNLSPYCILNLDKSTQPGSHWISLVKYGDNCIVYDSFGRNHAQIIPNLRFSGNGRVINTEDDAEQNKNDENCGALSLSFIIFYNLYGPSNSLLI